MSTITPTTLLDGAVVSTDAVNENFDLLHEVNGKLDAANLDMERTITYEQIQHRALSGGRTVAGTANLDYFNGVRYGIFGVLRESHAGKMNKSLENYLFVVTPTGTRVTDAQTKNFPQPNTAVRFFLDGSEYNKASLTRESREAMFTQPKWNSDPETKFHPHALRDRYKSRYWSGHAFLGQNPALAKGFHTASLRVASGRHVRQMRVRARSMKIMYFKA